MAAFAGRVVGALRLDVPTYEEVENDAGATGQAMLVVLMAAVANGVAGLDTGRGGLGFAAGLVGGLAGWLVWAGLTWVIGAKLLPEPTTRADIGQLLRTIGFAQAPGLLRVLGPVPVVGPLFVFAAGLWLLIAFVVAVRQALDYRSLARAVLVCILGFLAYVLVTLLVFVLLGLRPPGGAPTP
jgi:hypothetical protein